MNSVFITMEGPDGAGKSTQIELLSQYLQTRGYDVVLTREPGGTDISEAIREVILNKEYTKMGHMTELLLYAAARAQLVEEVIKPALLSGKAVICDRFVDSSAVDQGLGRELGVDKVYGINEYALAGISPDLTIFIDLEAEEGLKRKKDQSELDRMEMESLAFHQRVVEGYRQLAKLDPERIFKVDGSLPIEDISTLIITEVKNRLDREHLILDQQA